MTLFSDPNDKNPTRKITKEFDLSTDVNFETRLTKAMD